MNEYRFEANGKEYEVRFTIESLSKLEEWTGKGVMYLADENTFGINTIVNLLRAGLYHKQKGITQQLAMRVYRDFVEEGGNSKELFDEMILVYQKSVQKYMPTGEEEDDEGND